MASVITVVDEIENPAVIVPLGEIRLSFAYRVFKNAVIRSRAWLTEIPIQLDERERSSR